jgi:predicted dehydrogenase
MARTSAQCREIVAAAAKSGGFFMPAMVMRFWPEWAWLKNAIARQTFGKALAARFRRVCPPPGWSRAGYLKGRDSGGALLDLHVHDSDFVQFCFGRPRGVYSVGTTRFSGATDYLVTSYEVAGGMPVTAEGSWLMPEGFGFKMDEDGQKPRVIPRASEDGYEMELRYIIRCIQQETPPAIVTAADGLGAVEICEAEEKSIKTGAVVGL